MTDKRVIERLYSEFSACLLRERMDFCEYCDTAEYEGALHGELSTLAPELVDKYIWDAIHHTGDEANFKHFVPRIYELLWQGELPFADPEMVLGRLAHAEWEAWSVSQQESIRLVLDGLWDDALRRDDPPVGIDDLVCGIGLAFRRVPPRVEGWTHDDRPLAARRLAEFVVANATGAQARRLADPWWDDNRQAMTAVVNWLRLPAVRDFAGTG